MSLRNYLVVAFLALWALSAAPAAAGTPAQEVKITILSTMLAGDRGKGIGEWGFAALLEIDGQFLLVDTGERPDTVLRNAAELGIDLSMVKDVVITHNHDDHAGGLLTLRRELLKKSKDALSRAHVGEGILLSRPGLDGKESNPFLAIAAAYKRLGGSIVEHAAPTQLLPNVWMTGPVPRVHPERNWSGTGRLMGVNGLVEDTIPEDASVVVDTPEGLILISGCGHAGIINTVEYVRRVVRPAPLAAAIGGFHLFAADEAHLEWTGRHLKEFGLQHLIGAHCTGLEATYRLRALTGLTRKTVVVGAVGARFIRGRGIEPGWLAR